MNIVLQCILSKSWQVTALLLLYSDKQLEGITFVGGCRNELQIFIYSCLYSVCSFMCSGILPSSKVWALKITGNGGGVKILYKQGEFLGLDGCIGGSQEHGVAEQGAEQEVITSQSSDPDVPTGSWCFIRREQLYKRNRRFNHNIAGWHEGSWQHGFKTHLRSKKSCHK